MVVEEFWRLPEYSQAIDLWKPWSLFSFHEKKNRQQGSKAYPKSINRNMEKIVAAISLDMIAQGNDDEDIDLLMRAEYS